MAGSDLPSGGSGSISPPPRAPSTRSAKRKRGDSSGPASLPSRETRRSAEARKAAARKARKAAAQAEREARKAAVAAVRKARRAAAGALWTAETDDVRGRGFGDVEKMRAFILALRLARSVHVPDDDPDAPYPKIVFYLKDPYQRPRIDPVECQVSVPEWNDKPSDKETVDYKAASIANLGTIVCPLNMVNLATDEAEKTRKEWVDKCNCSHPGSEDCVRVHLEKARSSMKGQLGEEAFKNCGLDAMGEQVEELWTSVDKEKLKDVDELIPENEHQKFMKIALKELTQQEKKDLAKYYYNVFLPRRLASLTRAGHIKDEAIDTDNEK
uniref:Uncharacterized protein n=1 Tax=Avena sativa TaxID=4498 RepID=A0ACD5XE50_AVESA